MTGIEWLFFAAGSAAFVFAIATHNYPLPDARRALGPEPAARPTPPPQDPLYLEAMKELDAEFPT